MSKLFLLCDARDYESVREAGAVPAVQNYGVNEYLRLYRSFSPRPLPGAVMVISDKPAQNSEALKKNLQNSAACSHLLKSVTREYYTGRYSGVFFDFSPGLPLATLASLFLKKGPKNYKLYWSSEDLEQSDPPGFPVHLFTTDRSVKEQLRFLTKDNRTLSRDCFLLSPIDLLLPLPDLDSSRSRGFLGAAYETARKMGSTVFSDPLRQCHYFTFLKDQKPMICLFDTKDSFLARLNEVLGRGAGGVFCELRGLRALFPTDSSRFYGCFSNKKAGL